MIDPQNPQTGLPNCPVTNKVSYMRKPRGQAVFKRGSREALEVYRCGYCPYFHLTHKVRREKRHFHE